jgi:Tfp pilus assembly protein PilO
MKLEMTNANRVIVAMLIVAALATAFWILALSPKRDEVKKLDAEIVSVEASLNQHRAEIAEALEAREEFPVAYQQLVVLGKAVPGDDDTASLLVQLNRIAKKAGVGFGSFSLNGEGGGGSSTPSAPTPEASGEASAGTPTSTPVSPTEAAASLLPLGASIGPAGLAVMPYTLTFSGDFFKLADFIKGLDSLVKTTNEQVSVKGRLITIDGFSLGAGESGSSQLTASFEITTYLTPPSEGVTAGASPTGPGAASATPVSTTLGGTP